MVGFKESCLIMVYPPKKRTKAWDVLGQRAYNFFNICIYIYIYSVFICPSGGCLIYMAEAEVFGEWPHVGKYSDRLALVLKAAHREFLDFKRTHKMDCSQPRFTPARLNRKLQSRASARFWIPNF